MTTLSANNWIFLAIVATLIIGFLFYARTYLSLARHLNRGNGTLPEWSVLLLIIPILSIVWFLYLLIRLYNYLKEVHPTEAKGMWWWAGRLSIFIQIGSFFIPDHSIVLVLAATTASLAFFILHWIGLVSLKTRLGAR